MRVWVPGCATGEEAYSLAMVAGQAARVQRFATDYSRIKEKLGLSNSNS